MAANTEKSPEQVVQRKTSLPYQSRRMHALAQLKPKRERKRKISICNGFRLTNDTD